MPAGESDGFRVRARQSRQHYASAGCRYWLYEELALPGAYVEFFEAAEKETLEHAHRGSSDGGMGDARLYIEVDLT